MKINLLELLERDDKAQQLEHEEKGKEKEEQLRAGNSGLKLPDGNFAGQCPRKAYLRLKGVNIPSEENRATMFEFGRQNEVILIDKLKRTLGATFTISGDDTNHTEWKTSSGRIVSGSPDIIVAKADGTRLFGIEAKMIAALNTSRDVRFANKPKLAHVCQAAHYGWQLDLPMKLIYVQAVDFQTPMWDKIVDEYPKPGEPGSEGIEYSKKEIGPKANKRIVDMPKKLLPGKIVYDIVIDEQTGEVKYRQEGSKGAFTKTPVTIDALVEFYEHVDSIDGSGNLGPRPLTMDIDGSFAYYNICDYCGIKEQCDKFESKLTRWLLEIKEANDKGLLRS